MVTQKRENDTLQAKVLKQRKILLQSPINHFRRDRLSMLFVNYTQITGCYLGPQSECTHIAGN
jgi:hypothetical protein